MKIEEFIEVFDSHLFKFLFFCDLNFFPTAQNIGLAVKSRCSESEAKCESFGFNNEVGSAASINDQQIDF